MFNTIYLDESRNDAKPYSWDLQDFIEDTLGNGLLMKIM